MKSIEERVDEFVSYHIEGDGEANTVVLVEWADRHNLSRQDRFELAYFFSVTYSVGSAILLLGEREKVFADIKTWVKANKQKIVFQSDRKYIRMRDSFEKCLTWFKENRSEEHFLEMVKRDGTICLDKAISAIEKWPMFGRFSAFLFLEMYLNLVKERFENTTIDWKNGNTATSGLLNVFGMDDAADRFDKSGKLALTYQKMDAFLDVLKSRISEMGGSANVTEIETSLCAYRKFYKGSRYNGYYLDRMLEEMNKMKNDCPEIIRELEEIRADKFSKKYLGELSGWGGIRSKMKKIYKEAGIVT